jgi:hypothetical protein
MQGHSQESGYGDGQQSGAIVVTAERDIHSDEPTNLQMHPASSAAAIANLKNLCMA